MVLIKIGVHDKVALVETFDLSPSHMKMARKELKVGT